MCGCDLTAQLKGRDLGEVLFIPSVMLRAEGDLFLDDMSLEEASELLGVEIVTVDSSGAAFIEAIMEYSGR